MFPETGMFTTENKH